jgi:uncharacterized repeat protein (TIGR03803 family)
VLHSFAGGSHGAEPFAGVTMDSDGNLYGSTLIGGTSNMGTVYRVTLSVPFSAFGAMLHITPGNTFQLHAMFTQGAGAQAIQPLTQDLIFKLGTFSVTIRAGSFRATRKAFMFEGEISGLALNVRMNPAGPNSYSLQVEASGVDLSSLTNPVPVTLSIGNNTGTVQVESSR